MKNFRDEDGLIELDLSWLYNADVPNLRFDPAHSPAVAVSSRLFGRYRRGAVVAAGVAAALLAVLVAPSFWGGEAQRVSADQVFERASAAAENRVPADEAQSYHMVSTSEIDDRSQSFTTETWYGGKGRYRVENGGPDGYAFGQVVNGEDAWIYHTLDGVTRAAHGPAAALGADITGESLTGQQSLADVMAPYGKNCQTAELLGEGAIAGRPVYEIEVTPDAAACDSFEDGVKAASLAGSRLRLWVDQETFLTLQMEQRDPDGTVSYRQTASEFAVSPDMPESIFTYEAPEGVEIVEADDISEAKDAISPPRLNATDGTESCAPPKADGATPIASEC